MLEGCKTVEIGGHNYRLVFPHVFDEGDEVNGRHYIGNGTIWIAGKDKDMGPLSNQYIMGVLLHEIIHGIDHVFCGESISYMDKEEQIVEGLAQGLLCVLIRNPMITKEIMKMAVESTASAQNRVYYRMIQGDLGCRGCGKWLGDSGDKPCEKFHSIDMGEEMECPEKEGKK